MGVDRAMEGHAGIRLREDPCQLPLWRSPPPPPLSGELWVPAAHILGLCCLGQPRPPAVAGLKDLRFRCRSGEAGEQLRLPGSAERHT